MTPQESDSFRQETRERLQRLELEVKSATEAVILVNRHLRDGVNGKPGLIEQVLVSAQAMNQTANDIKTAMLENKLVEASRNASVEARLSSVEERVSDLKGSVKWVIRGVLGSVGTLFLLVITKAVEYLATHHG